ncbi:hypothetical protein [Mesobacillus zeae]|uniref:hypothetical protein n=1 Tax=Mesobacillus zeae TaxID=1917180 RepID=UPI00300AAA76
MRWAKKFDSRIVERKFKRELNKQGYFFTAKGAPNYLVSYEKDNLCLKTSVSKKPIQIKRNSIRKAISFMMFKRTAVRKEMDVYTNFSSALFGILFHIFRNNSKLQKLKYGEFRLSLVGTIFFASGLERSPSIIKVLKNLGGMRVLFNYKSILESPNALMMLEKYDLFCIVDSGAYSLFNEKKKKSKIQQQELFEENLMNDFTIEGYAKFINENMDNKRILGFLPLDVVGNAYETRSNYNKLKSLVPEATVYPVWQFTDSLKELETLVQEEHELICIGGLVPFISNRKPFIRKVLDKVFTKFPEQPFHALGIGDELLLEYGFFSSDSTAYLNAQKYKKGRKIYLNNGMRVPAPDKMSTEEIISQNLRFLLGLEERKTTTQLAFDF